MKKDVVRKVSFKIYQQHDKRRKAFWTCVEKLHMKLWGITYGKNLKINGRMTIVNRGQIQIGENVTINSASWANPIGLGERTYFQIFPQGRVEIGDGTGISNSAITCRESVTIGKNVLIGSGCKIYDTDFHPLQSEYRYGEKKDNTYIMSRGIIIEDGVFIGGGSFILKGSHIGKNSIIGAGSVVSGSVPANEIWAGNPARFIKKAE